MQKGVIIKGIGGFYYVLTDDGIIECKPRGLFRKTLEKPIPGDICDVTPEGSLVKIYPRKNELIRPPVANVDRLGIICATGSPEPNLPLIDKLLIIAEHKHIKPFIIINKIDLQDGEANRELLLKSYSKTGYEIIEASAITGEGIDEIHRVIKQGITAFAGSSGVGKSSLLNHINDEFCLKTGELSQKISRGKHTTRHVELLPLKNGGFVVDTPGFSSLELADITAQDLEQLFPEFNSYIGKCRFRGCLHNQEPFCAIKEAVETDSITKSRYESYLEFYNSLKDVKAWQNAKPTKG